MPQQEQESDRRASAWYWVLAAALLLLLGGSTAAIVNAGSTSSGSGTGTASATNCGNCEGNNGKGAGNGGAGVTGNPGHAIQVTGAVTGRLAPGRSGSLQVTVVNPNNQEITVRSVVAQVTAVTTRGLPGLAVCSTGWFQLGSFTGSRALVKNGSAVFQLSLTLLDKPFNQDNCKGSTYSFTFTASADAA